MFIDNSYLTIWLCYIQIIPNYFVYLIIHYLRFEMKEGLQNNVQNILSDIELKVDYEELEVDINDDIRDIIDEVEKADKPYVLSLNKADLYFKMAMFLLKDSKPRKAEEFAKKGLKIENSYEGYMFRGNALLESGDYKGALGYFDDALNYRKEKYAYLKKAEVLKRRGMDERALDSIKKAIEIDKDPDVFALYADTLVNLEDIEKAKEVYDKAEEIGGRDYKKEKVNELLKKAKNQSIPEKFDKILRLDDRCKEAWLGKAERYWNLGSKNEAIETLKNSLDIFEDDEIIKRLEDYQSDLINEIECDRCGGTGECINCEGTGNCQVCGGTGDCLDCEGSALCPNCNGSSDCPECDGSGKTGWFSTCEVCGGSGTCVECGGHGMCETCEGTGNCTSCKGNGNCSECQGSGVCSKCDGEGVLIKENDY